MARIRTIKPDFFRHADLYEAERESGLPLRLAFAGLWTAADREGRFRWSPRQLKLDCLPYDDVDFSRVLDALMTRGFVVKYVIDGKEYGFIPSWHSHQVINNRETPSSIPEPNENNTLTREARVDHAIGTPLKHAQGEGKGREEEKEGKEYSEANASGDADARPDPSIPEREYFMRGREVLGKGAGGLIGKLLKAKGGNVALARAAHETASTKEKPSEYVAACCRDGPVAKPLTEFQRKQQETNDVRAELRNFGKGSASGGTLDRLLPDDHGQRPEGLRGGLGPTVLAIPGAPGGRGH